MKTQIKSHGDEDADFCNEEIPKVESNHTCLAVIEKVIRHIIDDFESSSDDSGDFDDSDEEYTKAMKLMFLEKIILKI